MFYQSKITETHPELNIIFQRKLKCTYQVNIQLKITEALNLNGQGKKYNTNLNGQLVYI